MGVSCPNTRHWSVFDQEERPGEAWNLGQGRELPERRAAGGRRARRGRIVHRRNVAALAILARRHDLGMLIRLLEMAQMEAEEFVRLRGKRKLS
jgi:hypothetical protein